MSTYSTGIKLREIRGVGLQVVRLTSGNSCVCDGSRVRGGLGQGGCGLLLLKRSGVLVSVEEEA